MYSGQRVSIGNSLPAYLTLVVVSCVAEEESLLSHLMLL